MAAMSRSVSPFAIVPVALLLGCQGKSPAPAGGGSAPSPAAKSVSEHDPSAPAGEAPARAGADEPLGRLLDGAPFPIEASLDQPPAVVQKELGEPLGKGMVRKSCVRFVPDRVWFSCDYVEQRYQDPKGRFAAVGVEYTDGLASALSFEGLPGEGPFDPKAALAVLGIELPGAPRLTHPEPDVSVWSYFNNAARLRIHGKEYRVIVSVVDGDWKRSKVELLQNHPLTPEQQARVIRRDGGG